jgi:dihydrofolate reductase
LAALAGYRTCMFGSHRVEGYVIVSGDGMIADAGGEMPPEIRNEADQKFFQAALDRVGVIIHGRHSHEGGPHAAQRRRVIVTRQIAAIASDPSHPNSVLWNPAGATLEQAMAALDAAAGTIAVIGGPEVFSMFLPFYDAFHLSCAPRARIPGGRAVFGEVGPNVTPQDVLARHGLKRGPQRELDSAACVSVTTWQR